MQKSCPNCLSSRTKKNGHVKSTGMQNRYCNDCKRNFSDDKKRKYIDEDTKEKIRQALIEKISLRGICKVFSASLKWLMLFLVKETNKLPAGLIFDEELANKINLERAKNKNIIFCEVDELCTYVGKKKKKNGSGLFLIVKPFRLLRFTSATEVKNLAKHSGKKSRRSIGINWSCLRTIYRHTSRLSLKNSISMLIKVVV